MTLSKINVQLYAEEIKVEGMGNDISVYLQSVDLSELNGQVTLDELLSGWDVADIHSWVEEKLKDEN